MLVAKPAVLAIATWVRMMSLIARFTSLSFFAS
jgi:hypothetical protein